MLRAYKHAVGPTSGATVVAVAAQLLASRYQTAACTAQQLAICFQASATVASATGAAVAAAAAL